jgi:hypothetical protein
LIVVQRRPLPSLSSLSSAAAFAFLVLGLAPLAVAAGEKDKEATKLLDQAMGEDYLNTDFAKAEKKLKDALKRCGAGDACSPSVVGKLHVALGTIYSVGLNKPDQAKEALTAALKADPNAALDTSLSTPDLVKLWNDAKKAVPAATPAKPATPEEPTEPGGDGKKPHKKPASGGGSEPAIHTPPAEQAIHTPVPLYVEAAEDTPLSKITLRYKPFGAKQYKSLELKKVGEGFGAEIPCEDVSTTGEIRYYFALTDENGDAVGTLGSTKEPFKVTIKREIESEPPTLPGMKPPDQCKEKADCPPGLPGCPAAPGGKRGEKGWGASCEETQECQAGLACVNGSCEESVGGDEAPKEKVRHSLVSLGVQLDAMLISSKPDVCSPPQTGNFVCFKTGTANQFDGTVGKVAGTNAIDGGFNLASVRILASYSYFLGKKIPLSFGAQIGYAFGGSPSPGNTAIVEKDKRVLPARAFLPLHLEARVAYHFLGSTLETRKFRPYAFVGGGLAQVNGAVPVQVCDTTKDVTGTKCAGGVGIKTIVDAYQITGLNILDFGGGTTFGITPMFGVSAELKVMLMVPTFGVVFAPTIGPVVAF